MLIWSLCPVFQQIDIEKGTDGVIRMFGITEVVTFVQRWTTLLTTEQEGHTVLALITRNAAFESVESFMKDVNVRPSFPIQTQCLAFPAARWYELGRNSRRKVASRGREQEDLALPDRIIHTAGFFM